MTTLQWYKRYPLAYLDGTRRLSLEERGAYADLLEMIMYHGGSVDDDDRYLSSEMHCDVRVWRRIRERLIVAGKIYVADGKIHNKRADVEASEAIARMAATSQLNVIKGRKSGEVRRKNNGLVEPHGEPECQQNKNKIENEDPIKDSPPYSPPHEIAAVAACANDEQTSFIEPPPRSKPRREERAKATEQEFEAFWAEVPKGRRTGKIACQRKFATLVASGKATGEQIRNRMREYAELCREKATPLGSIKHPETWLNKGCWADEEQVVPTLDGLVSVCNGNQAANAYQRDHRPPGVRPGRITNAILEYSKMTGYDIRNLRI